MEILRKVSPGDRWQPEAAELRNLLVDVAAAWQAKQSLSQQEIGFGENQLKVYNATATTVLKFGVVGIGQPTFAPTVNESEFISSRDFNGTIPFPGQPFAIVQDLIQPDTIGPAKMMGVTQARLNVTDYAHKFAQPAGTYDYLASTASATGCEILWANSTGTTLAVAADDTETELVTASSEGYLPGMIVQIGDEELLVTAIDGQTWTVERGFNDTTADDHDAGASIDIIGGVVWGTVRICCDCACDGGLPEVIHLWHRTACFIYGGDRERVTDTGQDGNHYVHQDPADNDDAWQQVFVCAGGDYNFTVSGIRDDDGGIETFYVDDELILVVDWYAGSVARNYEKSTTAPVTLTSGRHILKGVVTGQNASSSGFEARLTDYWFAACPTHVNPSDPPPDPEPPGDPHDRVQCGDCELSRCLTLTIPDNGNTSECQNAQGTWVLESTIGTPSDPIGFPGFGGTPDLYGQFKCTWVLPPDSILGRRLPIPPSFDHSWLLWIGEMTVSFNKRIDTSYPGGFRKFWQARIGIINSGGFSSIFAAAIYEKDAETCSLADGLTFEVSDLVSVPTTPLDPDCQTLFNFPVTIAQASCDTDTHHGPACNDCETVPEEWVTTLGATADNPDCQYIFDTQLTLSSAHTGGNCTWGTGTGFYTCGEHEIHAGLDMTFGAVTLHVYADSGTIIATYTGSGSGFDCTTCIDLTRTLPVDSGPDSLGIASAWPDVIRICPGDGSPDDDTTTHKTVISSGGWGMGGKATVTHTKVHTSSGGWGIGGQADADPDYHRYWEIDFDEGWWEIED